MKQCKVGMDQENIISTFASTQFYGDPDAYIREFLQNAIDACNTRAALEWSWGTEFLEMEEARALNSMRNPYSPQISIQYNSETQRLVFEDNGIGMSEEFQKHIFESFSQERSSSDSGIEGSGLGMGIVKKLVDLMNGKITVQSKPGAG